MKEVFHALRINGENGIRGEPAARYRKHVSVLDCEWIRNEAQNFLYVPSQKDYWGKEDILLPFSPRSTVLFLWKGTASAPVADSNRSVLICYSISKIVMLQTCFSSHTTNSTTAIATTRYNMLPCWDVLKANWYRTFSQRAEMVIRFPLNCRLTGENGVLYSRVKVSSFGFHFRRRATMLHAQETGGLTLS